jgi:uncharacterized damage-inducible protein DinB
MAHDTEVQAQRDLLDDLVGRIAEEVHGVLDGIDEAHLVHRPDPEANTIAWLLWHLTRVEDDHVAGLAGTEQVWIADGYHERFGLPFEPHEHGYGHTSAQVGAVRSSAADLRAYQDAVHELARRYVSGVDAAELTRVVDTSWDPPVTAGVRLVSVLSDCLQHVGQAGYVRGLAERAP